MGFFEDTKPPEAQQVTVVHEKQWWPVTLLIFILTGVGVVLGWILKPLLTYLFTFEGRTRQQIGGQCIAIVVLFLTAITFLYQFWIIRNLFVSDTHTLNVSQYGGRITYPENISFKPEGRRRGFPLDSKIYITYAGYTKNVMQKIDEGRCQLVPNWNSMGFQSRTPPIAAEGFADQVKYVLVQSVPTLSWWEYSWERLKRPKYWFNGTALADVKVEKNKSENWKQFLEDWDLIWQTPDGYHTYEVRSLWNEHAVICF